MNKNHHTKAFNSVVAWSLIAGYLCLGFIPNLDAVDKIAPQWLAMSILNLSSLIFLYANRSFFFLSVSSILNSYLSITYILFIIWAFFSFFYSINPTEVVVNITRQVNVLVMFLVMSIFLFSLPKKIQLISWVIIIILGIEVYAVILDAQGMIKSVGFISSSELKGVTANRNITAFSIAMKIPFILFLLEISKKKYLITLLSSLILLSIICLSMIQSRASFIALGLILLSYTLKSFYFFYRERMLKHLYKLFFFIIPLFLALVINQAYLSNKGADAISRAATISLSTVDGSVNQRLRYYQDVLTHFKSNPFFGVGLGNWKLKSIEYDSKDIDGYVVPYHAHSDFIQLGAELGILGFILYLGIFLWALYFGLKIIRFPNITVTEKIFVYLILVALGVYSIDANLNFPIARPQVLVVWAAILALITSYYQMHQSEIQKIKKSSFNIFILFALSGIIPSIYVNNKVFESLKGQMFLLQDFNSNQYNLPLNKIDDIVPDIPNITVTTIPINSVKARYYFNAKKYDKAIDLIDKGIPANPYLFYSEILKSQIFEQQGKLDSAKVYAKKAFYGLPNNDLHSSRYLNLISQTRDKKALENAFELLTFKNKPNNWKNFLIIASNLYRPGDEYLIEKAEIARRIFKGDQEFEALYRKVSLGQENVNSAINYSNKGLEYFNNSEYENAAIEFEKAIERNPLDYAYYENAATSNYLSGNLYKALEQIDKVINELNPLNGKCEYIKALIFIKLGDPIGACPLLEISLKSGFNQSNATFSQYCK